MERCKLKFWKIWQVKKKVDHTKVKVNTEKNEQIIQKKSIFLRISKWFRGICKKLQNGIRICKSKRRFFIKFLNLETFEYSKC